MSLPSQLSASSAGLQHYDRLLALTGTQYRVAEGDRGIGVVLGMLDTRTGRLPIGLVNGKRQYYADILHYDANLRRLRVTDPDTWTAFVESYVGGGWLLSMLAGLGGLTVAATGAIGSVVLGSLAFLAIPILLLGILGLFIFAVIGMALYNLSIQVLPGLIGGVAAYAALCGLLSWEHSARRRRVGLALENLISRQIMPLFD